VQNKLVSDAAGYAPDRPGAFRFRIATARDLPHCVELLPPGCKLAPATRARLPEIWAGLLATEARVFPIIEDIERDHPENIGGFGLSVFVSDAFADELIATPRAYAPALFYDRLLAGDPVLLTRKDLHRVQLSGGINLFALHFGLHNHDLSDPRTVQILDTASASFYFFHAGYCIRTIMAEHYGGQAARYMERGGFRLVHDFRQTSALAGTPDDEMPAFFAQRREWIEPAAISGLAQLFAAKRARIHFSPGERRILERALLNESDAEIADAFGISRNAVLKAWRGIYERIDRRLPQLIPTSEAGDQTRGKEKRRHLLSYLRNHLEELRPSRPDRAG